MEWKKLLDSPKLLKRWSGRRGSNPRRPAWEIDRRLIIQNLASTGLIADDPKPLILQGQISGGPLMDSYWTLRFFVSLTIRRPELPAQRLDMSRAFHSDRARPTHFDHFDYLRLF